MSIFPTKVLLASDSSEDANAAARATADISERTGSELHVVHAWQEPTPPAYSRYPLPPNDPSWYEREASDLLTAQVKWIEADGGTVAGAHLRKGQAVEEILDVAEELDVGLIVVGRRGLGLLKSIVMGSVSDALVHYATRPVLVVGGGERAWPPSCVVIGEAFSEEAKGTAELAATLGQLCDASGVLVLAYPQFPDVPHELVHKPGTQSVAEDMRRAEEALQGLSEKLERTTGWRSRTKVVVGDAANVLLETAEEGESPAMIAVGARDLSRAERVMLGSVSTKVTWAASGPVLVHRRPAPSF